ncbi:HDOD domain-containing protein [Candidatus Syntrophocurvum alkaliphilum]|nr:HDOD domain-containing protein [Candidatus Syntrophocurvum alkaliphilum]
MDTIVKAVDHLPSLPHIVVQVIELTEDHNSTAQDINNVLNQDQGMTASVLKLANSAYYGFPRRISTVTDAIVLLGFRTVRSIVMAASVSDILNQDIEAYALEPGELWRHSQTSAMAARAIAKKAKFPALDLAYTGALLHDIGKVVLNDFLKQDYHKVIELVEHDGITFMEAEDKVLGFNHALVGAKVAEKWNLPAELVEAIQHHHIPEKAEVNQKLTAIVHLADFISISMGIGIGIDGMLQSVSSEPIEILNLNQLDIEKIISDLTDSIADEQSF